MCRQIAIPPGFDRKLALDILKSITKYNIDGFGYGYFDNNGKPIIKKSYRSIESIISKPKFKKFIDWPTDRWIIAHIRKATMGGICDTNTHPFIINDKLIGSHNGTFKLSLLVRSILPDKFNSSTDSEAALKLISKIGASKFMKVVPDDNGVYFLLESSGDLLVIKNSYTADLKIGKHKTGFLIASEIPYNFHLDSQEIEEGFYHFDKNGEVKKEKIMDKSWKLRSIKRFLKEPLEVEHPFSHNNYGPLVSTNNFGLSKIPSVYLPPDPAMCGIED